MNDEARQYLSKYTKKERLQNWFSYNKWWVLLFLLIILSALRLIWQNITRQRPDYQIAYVGEGPLPNDTVYALESALSGLGEDLNGDGKVIIQINQYPTVSDNPADDEALNQSAWETQLMADFLKNESSFFLLSDPDLFQQNYHILAKSDGSIPHNVDRSGLDKVYRFADCPVLASLDLGTYNELVVGQNVTGENQSLLENLYFGRRFYRDEAAVKHLSGINSFWEKLTKDAKPAEQE